MNFLLCNWVFSVMQLGMLCYVQKLSSFVSKFI